MMGFLPIGFTAPAVLAALALLPVIWWLLRLTPPRPQRVSFPPTRLLAEIAKREETPSKSPWWLTLLRLILATVVILAVAGPLWRPVGPVAAGDGPLLLVVDNGWAASHDWPSRLVAAEQALAEAEAASRPVVLAATAEGPRQPLSPDTAAAALERLGALGPRPWPSDRAGLVEPLGDVLTATPPSAVVWLSDGLAGLDEGFADLLAGTGASVTVVEEATPSTVGLAGIDNGAEALDVAVRRLPSAAVGTVTVSAHDLRGFLLGEATATFEPGSGEATARFELPGGLRNDIARLDVAASETAGAVRLVDERWRRRTVGLISGANADQAQPLLSPLHYLSRALAPFADLREPVGTDIADTVKRLVDEGVSIIVLADVGTLVGEAREEIEQWVENGGVLVRFAGPRLAEGGDDLVPVRLRTGGRVLGGSLSWEEPQPLSSFTPEGPFAGLPVPDDVTVNRQVLAEPDANLAQRTWASLGDGTPLVTAAPLGDGTIVLFHVTADTSWSNLPLSGGFVEMLRRLVALSSAAGETAGTAAVPLQPMRVLDGEGRFTAPGPEVEPLPTGAPLSGDVGPTRPPGLYGADDSFRAVNLLADDAVLAPLALGPLAGTATRIGYAVDGPVDLKPFLLTAAMLLLIADAIAVLILSGGFRFRRSSVAALAAGAVLAAALGIADPRAGADRRRRRLRDGGGQRDTPRLRHHRRCRGGRGEPARPRRPVALPRRTHGAGAGRAARRRSRPRRARLLPAALLAAHRRPGEAVAAGDGARRRLHEERRHHPVRHPRPADHRRLRRRRPGDAEAARDPRRPRYPAARAGAGRPRADQGLLPARRVPRPLVRRTAVGRGVGQRGGRGAAGSGG